MSAQGDLEETLREALALGDEGRWEEMAQLLAGALEDEAEDPYLLCWLGVAERELDNEGAAYEYFKRCLAQDPLDPHLLAMCGSGLAAFDDPDAAAALRAAALTGADIPETRLQYGAYLAREGLFQEALEQLEAAHALAPDDPSVRAELAVAHALKGDYKRALEHMEATLALDAEDTWNRVLLGLLQVEVGDLEPAAEELWRAAQEAEGDAEAQVVAALAAAAVGWDDAAQEAITRAPYASSGVADQTMIEEAEERIAQGAEAARALLLNSVVPTMLHDRLMEPL